MLASLSCFILSSKPASLSLSAAVVFTEFSRTVNLLFCESHFPCKSWYFFFHSLADFSVSSCSFLNFDSIDTNLLFLSVNSALSSSIRAFLDFNLLAASSFSVMAALYFPSQSASSLLWAFSIPSRSAFQAPSLVSHVLFVSLSSSFSPLTRPSNSPNSVFLLSYFDSQSARDVFKLLRSVSTPSYRPWILVNFDLLSLYDPSSLPNLDFQSLTSLSSPSI